MERKDSIVLASFLIVGSVCYTSYLHFTSSHSNELYVYNWGEYIDESVIDEFEAETGIHVTYDSLRQTRRYIRSSRQEQSATTRYVRRTT